MPGSQDQKFNDDLLLLDDDRKLAAKSFPELMHVLDFPELRSLFASYDEPANQSKKRLQRAGLATIALAVIALLGASTEPLYGQLEKIDPALVTSLIILSPIAGVFSIVIGTFGVFYAASKKNWLEARLMTERLRQFQFQTLVFRIPSILDSTASPEKQQEFQAARERWFSAFQIEYRGRLAAKLKEILDDEAEEQFMLHDAATLDGVDQKKSMLNELFSAYKLMRIKHQMQYANYKLRSDSVFLPRRQVAVLSAISLLSILLVFLAHFGISIGVSISYLSALRPSSAALQLPASIRELLHVAVIWVVVVALAARTFEEGLQPTREVERYVAYATRLGRLLLHFDETPSVAEKVRIMTEVERLVYQEMRGFLKTNEQARFVL
jgi:hypothetical protein